MGLDTKRVACELIIAVCVCAGARHFLVGSAEKSTDDIRRQIASLQDQSAGQSAFGRLSDDQVRDLQRVTAERVKAIQARSAAGADQTLLFERISTLAAESGVRIDSLNPIVNSATRAPALPPGVAPGTPAAAEALAALAAQPQVRDSRSGFTLTLAGTYSDAANFITSIDHALGYAIVKSVQISPEDGGAGDRIRASVNAELLAFDTAAVKLAPVPPATIYPKPIPPAQAAQAGSESPTE